MISELTSETQIRYNIETGNKIVFSTGDSTIFGMLYKNKSNYTYTILQGSSPGITTEITDEQIETTIEHLKNLKVKFYV